MAELRETLRVNLPDETATVALAHRLAPAAGEGGVIYLQGELGAGKTSFARALLGALGADERVKSPTYSLLERYVVGRRDAFHLDLYRISAPEEIEWLGMDELGDPAAIVLIEWPERGAGALPPADLEIALEYQGTGRAARLLPQSTRGEAWLAALRSVATSS